MKSNKQSGNTVAMGVVLFCLFVSRPVAAGECPQYLDHDFRRLHSSESVNICQEYAGRPLLIVNTASRCGFTPQFTGLEALHKRYSERGLVVIGFPSNDFRQEVADEEKAAEVCYLNYGVTFTMTAPISVRGDKAHPLFQELASQSEAPSWNFNKFLLNASGEVVKRYGSRTRPNSRDLTDTIESLL